MASLAVADVPNLPTGSRFLLMKFPRDKNTALLRLRALSLMPCSARAPAALLPSAAPRFGPGFRGLGGFYGLTPHMISTHALAGRRILRITFTSCPSPIFYLALLPAASGPDEPSKLPPTGSESSFLAVFRPRWLKSLGFTSGNARCG